jgi:Asp-tRNA(Asn)/Glu-tRNA(Gln) amidotransferase A subunit family amidase
MSELSDVSDVSDDTAWLDATGQAALVRDGSISPVELVDGAIDRITALNPTINAVIHELLTGPARPRPHRICRTGRSAACPCC